MALIGSIIIMLIIISAVVYLVPMVPIPQPFEWVKTAIVVLVVAGALIWLVSVLMGGGLPWPR